MKRIIIRLLPLALFAVLAIFLWEGLSLNPQKLPSSYIGKQLPDFQLPVLCKKTSKFTSLSMRNHISLLNVWASWCPECIDEQVFLLKLARQGVVIYGLNYKDETEDARRWLKDWGNPYREIGEDKNGHVAIDLGIYGAPETFLIDQNGVVQYRHTGVLNNSIWQNDFLPIIKRINKSGKVGFNHFSVKDKFIKEKRDLTLQNSRDAKTNTKLKIIGIGAEKSINEKMTVNSITLYPFDSPQKSAQFKHLLYDLRCPVCQNQDLAESNAGIAKDLRQEIYQFVSDGKADDEIIRFLTDRYGDFILFKPPVKGITMILWFGPLLLIMCGFLVFYRSIRRD